MNIKVETKGNFKSPEKAKEACLNFLANLDIKNAKNVQIKKGCSVLILERKKP